MINSPISSQNSPLASPPPYVTTTLHLVSPLVVSQHPKTEWCWPEIGLINSSIFENRKTFRNALWKHESRYRIFEMLTLVSLWCSLESTSIRLWQRWSQVGTPIYQTFKNKMKLIWSSATVRASHHHIPLESQPLRTGMNISFDNNLDLLWPSSVRRKGINTLPDIILTTKNLW